MRCPDYREVVKNPEEIGIPPTPAGVYFVLTMLVVATKACDFESVMRYVLRFDTHYQVLFMRMLVFIGTPETKACVRTEAYTKWYADRKVVDLLEEAVRE